MFSSHQKKLMFHLLCIIFLPKHTVCHPSGHILHKIGEKFTNSQNCLLIVNLFSDEANYAPKYLSRGKDQTDVWQDFLSYLISINGDSAWIIKNEKSLKSDNFKTVFSPEEIRSHREVNFSNVPPPIVPSMEVLLNFSVLNRGFCKCVVSIFLNYIYGVNVLRKRVFIQERNPFVVRGTLYFATVILFSFEPPNFSFHGIKQDLI